MAYWLSPHHQPNYPVTSTLSLYHGEKEDLRPPAAAAPAPCRSQEGSSTQPEGQGRGGQEGAQEEPTCWLHHREQSKGWDISFVNLLRSKQSFKNLVDLVCLVYPYPHGYLGAGR